jgi:hypothetical protein
VSVYFIYFISINPGFERIDDLLHTLERRRTIEKLGGGRNSIFSAGTSPDSHRIDPSRATLSDAISDPIIRKLTNLGMTEQIVDQLLSIQTLLRKLSATKRG